ncbi:pilus assembly PilX N-terminal domain-containing protein [Thermodesulfovibrionales bacterium]|nr:pilus assembly PilX N-terminal domain-containing protein [Thermodesulfovibrionales bacterium]
MKSPRKETKDLVNNSRLAAHCSPLTALDQKGVALITVLLMIVVVTAIGIAAVNIAIVETRIAANHKVAKQAFYAADAGIEYGLSKIRTAFRCLNPNLNIPHPTIAGVIFDEFTIVPDGAPSTINVPDGTFRGLKAFTQNFKITSNARLAGTSASSKLTQTVRVELIPIFQFGIFFEADLEILPGPNMTFTGGGIHSNSNIYIGSGASLSIDTKITSAGNIYNRRKCGTLMPGTVQIRDACGYYQIMNIDSDSENWATQSQTLWGGNVKSEVHGIHELNVPAATEVPIDILRRDAGSLYSKAGLRIIDGVARDKDGDIVDLTWIDEENRTVNPISEHTFFDHRENAEITVTEVNIRKLKLSTNAMKALDSPPDGGEAGILYVSCTNASKSVRLTEGADLPDSGLTVASNNPIYIQGNYNLMNRPAAVIGDAITILSNNWNDANSSSTDLDTRTASNTTVNAAIMAGNKNTLADGSQYSGGVENFLRFLENWSGRTFTFSGSLVCRWESQQAIGRWRYGSPVYRAPIRDWSFYIDADNLPPGTPSVINTTKVGWHDN